MAKLPSSSSVLPICLAAGAASICLFAAVRSSRNQRNRDPAKHVVASPLASAIPKLSNKEVDALPYPPDLFPGARNVDTPYGSMRVFEWGSETGRKVLLVHGISTPCISLGSVAERLVDQGCRVILFGQSTCCCWITYFVISTAALSMFLYMRVSFSLWTISSPQVHCTSSTKTSSATHLQEEMFQSCFTWLAVFGQYDCSHSICFFTRYTPWRAFVSVCIHEYMANDFISPYFFQNKKSAKVNL
jgi:hypothetical protein